MKITQASTDLDSVSPKEATAPPPHINFDLGSWMFGAGAKIEGAGGVSIDGLAPTSTLDGARARAAKAHGGATASNAEEDEWQLTVNGLYIGTWY